MQASYRIGLIVDGPRVPKWVRDLADWAQAHPVIELAAVLVAPPTSRGATDLLFGLERAILSKSNSYRQYLSLHPIDSPPALLHLAPRAAARTGEFELSADDLRNVKESKLDLLVRCGRDLPTGGLLDAARDGVVAVLAVKGPQAAGFPEVVDGCPETPFTIERLRGEGEPRDVLFEGSVATALFYAANVASLQTRAFSYLQSAIEGLASRSCRSVAEPTSHGSGSGRSNIISYGARTALRSLKKAARRYTAREFNWSVAFSRQRWWNWDLAAGTVVPNPPSAFLADPFTINVGGVDYLFVEEFRFDTRKGVISAYRVDGNEVTRIGVVLEKDYHLSFPFVFEHAGEIYMMPESGADRSVKLYRSLRFPDVWTEAKVLMSDVPAVDTILFKEGSLWWMLTTIQGPGPGLNNAELHAFYATDPLGEWAPHQRNPVVMDAGKGRNGGFLRDEERRPCRVAQLPGFTFYGAGSAVYRIDEISPETYRETLVKEVRPDFFPNLDGTHHIHAGDGITVYDFMRVERPRLTRAA